MVGGCSVIIYSLPDGPQAESMFLGVWGGVVSLQVDTCCLLPTGWGELFIGLHQ